MAGARASPQRHVGLHSGKAQCFGPATDPGEKVTLDESGEVFGANVGNAPLVNVSGWNKSG